MTKIAAANFAKESPIDGCGGLVYYDAVPQDVVARSSVLSNIAQAAGDARLPDAVSLDDLRTWHYWSALDLPHTAFVGFRVLGTVVKVLYCSRQLSCQPDATKNTISTWR